MILLAKKGIYKDHDLIQLFRDKNFDKLYECSENLLMNLVNRYPNLKIDDDEKLELGYIAFAKAIQKFDPDSGFVFGTYLSRILINDILMILRKERSKIGHGISEISLSEPIWNGDGTELFMEDVIPSTMNTEAEYEQSSMYKYYLDLAHSKLSPTEYNVLLLHIEGKKQREIAEITELSQAYVSRVIKKIFRVLKNSVEKENRKEQENLKIMRTVETSEVKKRAGRPAGTPNKTKPVTPNVAHNWEAPTEKVEATPVKNSLLKTMVVGAETGNVYDSDKEHVYIQVNGTKVAIPHDQMDAFVEELCEYVESI